MSFQHLVRGLTDARPHGFGLCRRLRSFGTALAESRVHGVASNPYPPARPRKRDLSSSLTAFEVHAQMARRSNQMAEARTRERSVANDLRPFTIRTPYQCKSRPLISTPRRLSGGGRRGFSASTSFGPKA